MSKVLVQKEKNYTVISNNIFKDTRLSFKAKGLLVTMLSCPPEWNYTIEGLSRLSTDGKTAIRSALVELEECGYLERRQIKDDKGRFLDVEYVIYEEPIKEADLPQLENVITENQTQLNTDRLNTTKNIKTFPFAKASRVALSISYDNKLSNGKEVNNRENYTDSINNLNNNINNNINKNIKKPAKGIDEQLEERALPIYEQVLHDPELAKDLLEITEMFYDEYRRYMGRNHKILSDMGYENIAREFIDAPEIMGECDYDIDAYKAMIEKYFMTMFFYTEHFTRSFSHFMAQGIRDVLFRKVACGRYELDEDEENDEDEE